MKKHSILTITLLFSTLSFATNVESLNLRSMYEGAKEVEMLNKAMEAGMREHNQPKKPILVETVQEVMDTTPIEEFQELDDRYYLERVIEDRQNTNIKVTTSGNMVKIETKTTKKEHKSTPNGMSESSFSSSSTEELSLPYNADLSRLSKEIKDGVLKISVPKRKKF
jgi:HSP20 family molecular chaperone IbpA